MLPASNRAVGQNVGTPDVCNTPDTVVGSNPIAYTNTGDHTTATPFSTAVYISCVNALSQASTIPTTTGDEAGTLSSTKGVGTFLTGNPIVYVDFVPAITLSMATAGNNMNCSTGVVSVPTLTNVFFSKAGAAPGGAGAAAALSAELEAPAFTLHREEGGVRVRIRLVTLDLAPRVATVAEALRGNERLVLDLRGCPGGDLDGAARLASLWAAEGEVLWRQRGGERRAGPGRRLGVLPIVWVDGGTASAAEAAARGLRVAGARVLGEPTAGKAFATRFEVGHEGALVPVETLPLSRAEHAPGGGAAALAPDPAFRLEPEAPLPAPPRDSAES